MHLWKGWMLQQWALLVPAQLWALLMPWVPRSLVPVNWQALSARCRPAMSRWRGLQRHRQLPGQQQRQGARLLPCKTVGCEPLQTPACLPSAPGLQTVTLLPLPPLLLLPHRQEMQPAVCQVGQHQWQRDHVVSRDMKWA